MSREPKKPKIDTNATGPLSSQPFASLDIGALPSGPLEKPAEPAAPAKLGRVVLRRETAHRGGKTVVIIHDFAPTISGGAIDELSRKLRKACGCGGTVRNREIEIQGDQPGKIRALLENEGFRVAGIR